MTIIGSIIDCAILFVNTIFLVVTAPLYVLAVAILSILTNWGITGKAYAWAPLTGFITFRTYKDGTLDYHVIEYEDIFRKH